MDKKEIETCLSHLAVVNKNVSASTQRQALNPIFFLFREVLDNPIEVLKNYLLVDTKS